MQAYPDRQKHQYIVTIIQALHLKLDTFIYNLAHQNPYETLLYTWITKLYTKGKSSDEALQLIYKARNRFLLRCELGLSGEE